MFLRPLLIGLAILIIILVFRRFASTQTTKTLPKAIDMVRCHHCGVYLPKPNAVQEDDRYYCCRAHQQADS